MFSLIPFLRVPLKELYRVLILKKCVYLSYNLIDAQIYCGTRVIRIDVNPLDAFKPTRGQRCSRPAAGLLLPFTSWAQGPKTPRWSGSDVFLRGNAADQIYVDAKIRMRKYDASNPDPEVVLDDLSTEEATTRSPQLGTKSGPPLYRANIYFPRQLRTCGSG